MSDIVDEAPEHFGAREALLDRAFGRARHAKTSERLREGRLPALAFSAVDGEGRLVATVRLWNVATGDGREILLLGPLAVEAACRSDGLGGRLMRHALNRASLAGYGAVILVGDAPYYERFGFSAGPTGALDLPGPVERSRFLGLELRPDALAGACGLIRPSGALAPADRLLAILPETQIVAAQAA
ncbi:GNAT family N-acetyltransferase [Polymorphum gilvum]|uniref:Acetyltransferase, GNAT family n=1 Tax=Polymorphum gilvum (strain LMG 25793 / CGMCC 1.9160 / SL003B-26A1) TaxID=991905 RepID=F2IV90_POLGS|nr:N-acetyltransferase [Polymorphum gilvum]ADZ71421.1 Acetyltransferase, GNAT family [Polymorphum gilvum SL003B-26A1]